MTLIQSVLVSQRVWARCLELRFFPTSALKLPCCSGKVTIPFGAWFFSSVKWKAWTPESLRSFELTHSDIHSYLSIFLARPRGGGRRWRTGRGMCVTHVEFSDLSSFHILSCSAPASVAPGYPSNMLSLFPLQALCMFILSAQNALAPASPPYTQAHRGFHGSSCLLLQEAFPDYRMS